MHQQWFKHFSTMTASSKSRRKTTAVSATFDNTSYQYFLAVSTHCQPPGIRTQLPAKLRHHISRELGTAPAFDSDYCYGDLSQ